MINRGKKISITSYILGAAILVIAVFSINYFNRNTVGISFYHWKSEFNPSEIEIQKLRNCRTDRIYLHLFDVDKQQGNAIAAPKAKLKFTKSIPSDLNVIPVIYITNRTFEKTTPAELKELARNISSLSNILLKGYVQQITEFQIDCDWTLETKAAYFEFLNDLKEILGEKIPLSATIRLHQVKYHLKTGIPPVNRGMLMFYNMGDIKEYNSTNTIYDFNTADLYLKKLSSYPLPLDYALPVFSWKLHYRLGKIKSIISELSVKDLSESKSFTRVNEIFVCKKAGFIHGNYFLKGDIVKIESTPISTCEQAAKQISKHLNSKEFQLVFYHLGSEELKNYDASQLKNISNFFN